MRSAVAVSLAIVIVAPGCEQGPADDRAAEADPTFTAWDSAGIEIVENHAPAWPAGTSSGRSIPSRKSW